MQEILWHRFSIVNLVPSEHCCTTRIEEFGMGDHENPEECFFTKQSLAHLVETSTLGPLLAMLIQEERNGSTLGECPTCTARKIQRLAVHQLPANLASLPAFYFFLYLALSLSDLLLVMMLMTPSTPSLSLIVTVSLSSPSFIAFQE
ncbi:hypothetical protein SAY87_000136 [Trapa incisa]|uniref:Uncharacterized protein n=1 Tax=Trapa incisa TaxID=236973 RepID=A0AAN7JGR2_9MYRT|nr:hypothetical protein SAY87_000136 [Trapa incisa]